MALALLSHRDTGKGRWQAGNVARVDPVRLPVPFHLFPVGQNSGTSISTYGHRLPTMLCAGSEMRPESQQTGRLGDGQIR